MAASSTSQSLGPRTYPVILSYFDGHWTNRLGDHSEDSEGFERTRATVQLPVPSVTLRGIPIDAVKAKTQDEEGIPPISDA